MKKTTLGTTISLLALLALFSQPVVAADVMDPVTASSGAVIKKIIDSVDLKKTQAEMGETAAFNQLVGYTGTISDIKQSVFSLETSEASLQVSLSTTSAIIKNNAPLRPELLSLKDRALVIGLLTSPDIIAAKRVVIYQETTPVTEKKIILATITKVNLTNQTISLEIDKQIIAVNLSKKLKLDLKSLKPNQKIFGVLSSGSTSPGSATLLQAKVI